VNKAINFRKDTTTKTTTSHIFIASALVRVLAMSALATRALAQETHFDKLANLPFTEGRPTKETAQTLRDELLFQRATQTYLWALPLINTLGMQVGSEKTFGAGYNVLPIWKQRLDAKTLVTTPNFDVLYAMSYVDLGKDAARHPTRLLVAPHPGRWRQVLW
jgi:hypothetical protein